MTSPGLSALAQVPPGNLFLGYFPWILSGCQAPAGIPSTAGAASKNPAGEGKAASRRKGSLRDSPGNTHLALCSLLTIPCLQFHASRWNTRNSLLVTPYSQFLTHNSLLTIPCWKFLAHNSSLRIPCWQSLAPSSWLVPPLWHNKCPGNTSPSQREKKPPTPVQKDFIHGINPWHSWECNWEAPLAALLQLTGEYYGKRVYSSQVLEEFMD